MKRFSLLILLILVALGMSVRDTDASRWTADMKEGKLAVQSLGSLAFGPDGVLFAADTKAAAIVAISTGDTKAGANGKLIKGDAINDKIAAMLGTTADQILIEDMAVNPISRNVYMSVSRGRGPDAVPVLVRVKGDGQIEVVSLEKVKHSVVELPDAPPVAAAAAQGARQAPSRQESITDLAFVNGKVVVAGLSNEEFGSSLRAIPFPFQAASKPTGVEIYHGAHGRFETRAPVRTFVPFKIGSQDHILAAYTCTPLVQFSLNEVKPGAKIKGKTIGEFGNRNRPLDIIVYEKDGKTFLLIANSSRGIMKITTDKIDSTESIVDPVPGGGTKGLPLETIASWTGITQLDRLDKQHAVVVRKGEGTALNLESLPLP
ncbi:MAG TPA: hypothetical protein VG778_01450 [Blastocatellia bacterium]|nr:hypothetical protein [Blastocatellia bacterium]